ncbi:MULTISPECIES: hypothetical protein [Kitasatospora]|uniref:Uncharacterized protein n=1 Tax=Kitasatospora cheerisanensis KCTC 2395 TaxID=1348663 RepID=A0A066YUM8_9ACTN|nr:MULTISPECIES: hypothetical protein [Kitasatospora]KDN81635.1 hypothetical protein KCH_65970 [Kitasatospora cheerisanensis KCTC 2395]PJN29832.1 hypothetical protein CG736_04790 [Kitasatospora sp. CB02891]GGQ69650.1 hypothetical protein GCM10010195_26500 [Kitasatospora griseola]
MTRIRALATAVLLPLLFPVHLLRPVLEFRLVKLRAARASGDRGAISIELALAVIVLVAIAGAVVYAITQLGTNVKNKIPQNVPDGGQAP